MSSCRKNARRLRDLRSMGVDIDGHYRVGVATFIRIEQHHPEVSAEMNELVAALGGRTYMPERAQKRLLAEAGARG